MSVKVKHYDDDGYHLESLDHMMRIYLDERDPNELKEAFITLIDKLVEKNVITVSDACMIVPGMDVDAITGDE